MNDRNLHINANQGSSECTVCIDSNNNFSKAVMGRQETYLVANAVITNKQAVKENREGNNIVRSFEAQACITAASTKTPVVDKMRQERDRYHARREKINAQKRAAYAIKKKKAKGDACIIPIRK